MLLHRVLLPAIAAAFLSAIPLSATGQPGAPPYCGAGYGNGVMGFLTPEQRMMHFAEVQKATAEMSFNDMRDYRWNLRNKVMAMSAAERKKFADDLSAKWNALTPAERSKIQEDFMAFRGSGRGMGRGHGMGRGMGMGGCWW